MNATEFLAAVVTAEQGYFELCIRNTSWRQEWYEYPNQINKILESVESNREHGDVYFSSYLFSTRESKREYVLPSRTIQQDLDYADTSTLPLVPTVLVSTSPNRHQAYWVLSQESEQHEFLSKRLAYAIPNCDRSGWPLGRKVRFPGTFNYKYPQVYPVEVVNVTNKRYTPDVLELLPDLETPLTANTDYEFIAYPPTSYPMGPHELLESIKDHISAPVYAAYLSDNPATDRSAALFALMTQCFKAGLTREQVYWIAFHSANNKFLSLRFNAERELAKDVLRSEHAVKSLSLNIRELINDMRKTTKLLMSERRRAIFEIVLTAMKSEGEFTRTVDNRRYYTSGGRPIDIDPYNPDLAALLDIKYALNKTEVEHTYTVDSMIAYSSTLPETGVVSALSYYDTNSNQLLVHSGRKAVYSVTAQGVEQVTNGTYGVIFPWDFIVEPFTPDLSSYVDWGHVLFGDVPNCLNMTAEQVECVLKVWLMFLLLRHAANSRPILAFFGQPGCMSANTKLRVNISRYHTIKDLYEEFHGFRLGSRISRPVRIESLDNDGKIRFKNIADVISSGRKEVFEVITRKGLSVKTTKDHLFLTQEGYKPLSDLKSNDVVVIRQQRKPKNTRRKRVPAKWHPYASTEHATTNHKIYKRIAYHRALLEAELNNLDIKEFLSIINFDYTKAQALTYLPKDTNVHHQDRDKKNDDLSNLDPLTREDHARIHADASAFDEANTEIDWIKSITSCGEEDTYDIRMEDESAPNFVAHDFVVHNSSKTTLARKIYAFLYGKHMDVSGVTNSSNFDMATANLPFFALDNADTWEKWLPDRLAQSAGKTDVLVRRLYSNNQMIRLKRQSLIAVTAHDPKFGRADVADRMIIFSLQRFENLGIKFKDEAEIINTVLRQRNRLWGSILQDARKVLSTPIPKTTKLQLRIQDFARLGEWIALSLNCQETFASAISSLKSSQQTFNLDEDHALVAALKRYIAHIPTSPFKSQDQIYKELISLLPEEEVHNFQHLFKSSSQLIKRISNLQSTLNTIMTVEFQVSKQGDKLWRITPKVGNSEQQENTSN